MKIVIASNKTWHWNFIEEIKTRTDADVVYFSVREDITKDKLVKIQPDWVFFPHWSHIIPAEVYENFRCVIFHMTDLPFGRGGSPLQNLISRGIYETKLSAIRCVKELDAGEVYKKVPLSLWGSAEEIYLRAAELIKEMIVDLVLNPVVPVPQSGEIVTFQRRKPADGNVELCGSLNQVFDYIRMLDADTYPKAFLETEKFRLEFSRASLRENEVLADVKIIMKGE